MEACLGDSNYESDLLYLDDIIVFSENFQTHLKRLGDVLVRLEQHRLKVKPSKCHLLQEKVHYLGHVVSAEGIATEPEKCATIRDWPTPSSVQDVRRFLGMAGFYRRFTRDYAKLAGPMYEVIAKPKACAWTTRCQVAFDQLKQKLSSPPILAYADYSLPFRVYTDASATGLGPVLTQFKKGQKDSSPTLVEAFENQRGMTEITVQLN